jgi:eukaryotic-like serine/threonine-protein kinase
LNKPTPFGKYYLLERINVGGMAEVFKAKVVGVEGFERIVALKRILPHIAEDEEFITMFIDEAKIAVQLQHANIAQIFDLGKVDDAYFIALEYVQGRDLRGIFDDLRKHRHTMPMPQVCYVTMQVCEGLDYAHNKRDAQGRALNLVHRDVSPQNVLIGYEGEVKLIDFGIAKAAGKASKTQAGILKGKFGYMSPEQVRGLSIDRRSDIFAVGIILYEMLTGERLFVGESDFSTLEKVRNVEVVPPSSFNSQIPEQLERIVLKALAKDLEDRYQNALDLHDDLQAFLYSVGQFSSRKDLSVWMKRTFSAGLAVAEVPEIAESEDIEEIEPIEADADSPAPAHGVSPGAKDDQALGWDDDELETSIFDRPVGGDTPAVRAEDAFLGTEDKTVAAAPSEASLREMNDGLAAPSTFSDKVPTQKEGPPVSLRQTVMGMGNTPPVRPVPLPQPGRSTRSLGVTPAPHATQRGASLSPRPLVLPVPAARPTPQAPVPMGRPLFAPLGAPSAPEPPRPALRQTLLGMGAPKAPIPGASVPAMPAPPSFFPAQPFPGFDQGPPALLGAGVPGQPYGMPGMRLSGGMDAATVAAAALSLRPPSRAKYYLLFLAFMALGGGGAYLYLTRSGKMQIAVKPVDARVTVDGVALHEGPPYVIERRPGIYHVAVARDGYVSREQDVEIRTAQVERVEIEMEASPDTGFELTSQPPGGLVWLDGQAFVVNETGKQATTNFRASRITPGRHVLEIKGDPRFKDWRQEIFQEPGQTLKINAAREPGSAGASASVRTVGAVAAGVRPPSTSAPSPPATGPSVVAENRGRSSGSRRASRAVARVQGSSDDGSGGQKPAGGGKTRDRAPGDEDVFENEGRLGAGGGQECVANIGSKPWAQVAIDGKPTGKSTPLIDYSLACGKHRITFTNSDLMIERNEIIILKPGQRFKKIFPLVDMDF